MDSRKKACVAIILAYGVNRNVKRKYWMKKWLQKREHLSHINIVRMLDTEKEDFRNYFRMSESNYKKLLEMVDPFLIRQDTVMRKSLSVHERLTLTLRYLATGRSFEDLKFSALMSPAAISTAILETCQTLIYVLKDYIKFPTTTEDWVRIANDFGSKHNFFNCLGAIDGKHIQIRKPAKSGSVYYNYKGFYSIVLLAVVNAQKEFIMIDVGINGRISDGGVMFYSKFGELFQQNALNLPEPSPLPNSTLNMPYAFVADEAFALNVHLMKPYSQKLLDIHREEFNNRLSRARVVVENAFGILSSRFGVFQKPIGLEPEKATTITMASCYLHNFLSRENKESYNSSSNGNGEREDINLVNLQKTLSRNSSSNAKQIRDKLCQYYNNDGKL